MQVSINLKGESGLRMIRKIMDTVREANGKLLAAIPAEYTDIQSSEVIKFNQRRQPRVEKKKRRFHPRMY